MQRNRRKLLPDGVPDTMFENPETVNAPDFAVRLYHGRGFRISHIVFYVDYRYGCAN